MESLKKLKDAIAANAAQAAVARDVFNQKVQNYEQQLKEATELLEATTAALKELVDSLMASGGPTA